MRCIVATFTLAALLQMQPSYAFLGFVPFRKRVLVSLWDATHCNRARALQTLLEAAAVSWDGLSSV